MKRLYFLYLGVLITASSFAQKGIDGLIQAEKNFAAYSVANGTKDAFLANMDSSSLVFDKGKAVSGLQLWSSREKRKGVLDWRPSYAEISGSNDFGYTSGPWTFRLSATDSIIARGFYSTVWHINKEGKWTFLVDLGIDNTPADNSTVVTKISAEKNSATTLFIDVEKAFIRLVNQDSSAAYKKYLSKHNLINRNGHLPVIVDPEASTGGALSAIQYTIQGWVLSPGNDMACVYGNTMLNGKQDNYMRIWRHERNGWKIALEVLHH